MVMKIKVQSLTKAEYALKNIMMKFAVMNATFCKDRKKLLLDIKTFSGCVGSSKMRIRIISTCTFSILYSSAISSTCSDCSGDV